RTEGRSMARRANPTLIGAFVVGGLTLAVVGLVVFGGGRFFRLTKPAVAYFEGSVKGVAIGAPVTFQGAKIGSITDVRVVLDTETLHALRVAVLRSGEALAAVEKLARNVDGQVGPMAAEVKATAESARSALAEAERTINQVGKTADGTLAQAQGTLARLEPTVEV